LKERTKEFFHVAYAAGTVRDSPTKVFCCFSSEGKTFLPHPGTIRPLPALS
jgi:hypothetical protein